MASLAHRMTPDEERTFQAWLQAKQVRPDCLLCAGTTWYPSQMIEFGAPVAARICQTCCARNSSGPNGSG
jgi:hypothetical protein